MCKVKGIRLNYMNSHDINFESIKTLLFKSTNAANEKANKIELKMEMILRERDGVVYSMLRMYNYSINITKRRRLSHSPYDTLPFGHA